MTIDKKTEKRDFAAVANFRDKNEKASWLRKKKNLETLVSDIAPIETEIMRLTAQKTSIMDEINEIRKTMIVDCIHPQDYLIHYGVYIKCRFCETKVSIPKK